MTLIEAIALLLSTIGCLGIFWAGYIFGYSQGCRESFDHQCADRILEMLKEDAPEEIKKGNVR
jgi:hypothetical protein